MSSRIVWMLGLAVLAGCDDELPRGEGAPDAASRSDGGGAPDASAPRDAGDALDASADAGLVPPLSVRVEGTASGDLAATREHAECSFWADVGELDFDPSGAWAGTVIAGEVFRTITVTSTSGGEGPRYEFSALIAGPATMTVSGALVEVRVVGDQSAPEVKPFWKALEVLTGTISAPFAADGRWTCAPLMIDEPPGFVDVNVEADGPWTVTGSTP